MATQAEIDRLPVASLPDRYNVARSQIYNRIKALGIETEKVGTKSYVNGGDILLLDRMHDLIKAGKTLEEATNQVLGRSNISSSQLSTMPQDSPMRQSYEPRDNMIAQPYGLDLEAVLIAVAQGAKGNDRLQLFRDLEECAANNWRLSTSQLAEILGTKPLGDVFDRYGFHFEKAGKHGRESAWKIEKLKAD